MEVDDNKIIVPDPTIDLLEEKVIENNRREIERYKESVILQKRNEHQTGAVDMCSEEMEQFMAQHQQQ